MMIIITVINTIPLIEWASARVPPTPHIWGVGRRCFRSCYLLTPTWALHVENHEPDIYPTVCRLWDKALGWVHSKGCDSL